MNNCYAWGTATACTKHEPAMEARRAKTALLAGLVHDSAMTGFAGAGSQHVTFRRNWLLTK